MNNFIHAAYFRILEIFETKYHYFIRNTFEILQIRLGISMEFSHCVMTHPMKMWKFRYMKTCSYNSMAGYICFQNSFSFSECTEMLYTKISRCFTLIYFTYVKFKGFCLKIYWCCNFNMKYNLLIVFFVMQISKSNSQ